jgi:hypothetical protein
MGGMISVASLSGGFWCSEFHQLKIGGIPLFKCQRAQRTDWRSDYIRQQDNWFE